VGKGKSIVNGDLVTQATYLKCQHFNGQLEYDSIIILPGLSSNVYCTKVILVPPYTGISLGALTARWPT